MTRIYSLFLFLLVTNCAYPQDSLRLFYINRINISGPDSSAIAQCKKTEYKSVTLEINLYHKNSQAETIYAAGTGYQWWKDSVFFSYSIPAVMFDSMVIHPVFQISCNGLNGNRGTENLEADGEAHVVRNITMKFVSNPPGASVYLIPKMLWERTPGLKGKVKNEVQLGKYAIYNGTTPVQSLAQEYVYIALFRHKNQFIPIECSPTHFNPVDTVYANFSTQ